MRTFYRAMTSVLHVKELDATDASGKMLPPHPCINCEGVHTYDVYQVVHPEARRGPICYLCVDLSRTTWTPRGYGANAMEMPDWWDEWVPGGWLQVAIVVLLVLVVAAYIAVSTLTLVLR